MSATGIVEGQLGQSVTLYLQIKGTGVFFEWVTKVVEMLESAARAAGYAIKKFFEGVGCEIASWFGSKCKDRKVEVEVTQQENVTQPEGLHDPDRDVQPAELAVEPRSRRRPTWPRASATSCGSTSARPARPTAASSRPPRARSTRSRTSAASPAPSRSA